MTTPTKPNKEATTPLPVLTEALTPERVRELRDTYEYVARDRTNLRAQRDEAKDILALADHWLRTQWQPIETAPKDVEVILGWWSTWPNLAWQVAAGIAGSTKGGWIHGHATHWRPIPDAPPQEPA